MWIKIRRFSQNGRIKKKEKNEIYFISPLTLNQNIYKNTNQNFVCV